MADDGAFKPNTRKELAGYLGLRRGLVVRPADRMKPIGSAAMALATLLALAGCAGAYVGGDVGAHRPSAAARAVTNP